MIRLNRQQADAVAFTGHVAITACPGSGKTRVLIARVIRGLSELSSSRHRIVALTFTNRAADEIQTRLDQEGLPSDQLWAGTIHGFALEWILRPYAPYCERLRFGFSVADEFYTDRLLKHLLQEEGLPSTTEISTAVTRTGAHLNKEFRLERVFTKYKDTLRKEKLIDYDDVLYFAYKLLQDNPEIGATLGTIFRVVCVDEVQDIQDLQFGILSLIFKASARKPTLFFVGDDNQCIYESLGALSSSPADIAKEFGLAKIGHLELKGNYRSTRRIIDLFSQLRPSCGFIEALAEHASQLGMITFHDQTISKEDLVSIIAGQISAALRSGVQPKDICVIAPHWWHVRTLARNLVSKLPKVDFDAPGLSPLYSSRDNVWFKVSRLFLTSPSPSRVSTRSRWAKEVLFDLYAMAGDAAPQHVRTSRQLLRIINGITSGHTQGTAYLKDVFQQLLNKLEFDIVTNPSLKLAFDLFFEKIEARFAADDGDLPNEILTFKKLFSHPSGVVVNTCHGVKGEEFDTVIAFGLLRGYIPNWSIIIHGHETTATEREAKLLYVICSRAKRRLHLIAESGRKTGKGNPYETSKLLKQIKCSFD